MADTQSRKWQITVNDPLPKGITHDTIRAALSEFKSLQYYCLSDEIGLETQTYHTHIFLAARSPVRFSTIKARFSSCHIEQARGSAVENRAYILKEGEKYADKSETSVPDTFEEWGDIPDEPGQGYRSDIALLYSLIVDGKSNAQIMSACPDLAIHINRMDKIRTDFLEELYSNDFRKISVIYIFGETETGKTRGVLERHGYSDVFRVTDYDHPFDRYNSQPVLLFDEFRSQLRISDMLTYLEGYPLTLPARYAQRVACFTEVYIISNIDLRVQYPNVQRDEPATWKAFLRRIGKVLEYTHNSPPIDHGNALDYLYPNAWVVDAENVPVEPLMLSGDFS